VTIKVFATLIRYLPNPGAFGPFPPPFPPKHRFELVVMILIEQEFIIMKMICLPEPPAPPLPAFPVEPGPPEPPRYSDLLDQFRRSLPNYQSANPQGHKFIILPPPPLPPCPPGPWDPSPPISENTHNKCDFEAM
jgi:hypothetical protein